MNGMSCWVCDRPNATGSITLYVGGKGDRSFPCCADGSGHMAWKPAKVAA